MNTKLILTLLSASASTVQAIHVNDGSKAQQKGNIALWLSQELIARGEDGVTMEEIFIEKLC